MQGIIFKQSYKSRNRASTPMLNRKHLIYIATRFGAVHNPRCGFGLFGRLPDMPIPDSINSLEKAKAVITDISKQHTVYRAILSVDHETALKKGYYNRQAWEQLIQKHTATIAKEMRIDECDLRWAASYHHARRHPHVHIMYWDNSNKIRNEYIPKKQFEIATEHIKAAINRTLFSDELSIAQTQQQSTKSELKLELLALFRDMNLADALNLNHVTLPQLDVIGEQLQQLFLQLPKTGRLAYQFLPPAYKAQLHDCIDTILQIKDFQQLQDRLIHLTDDVSTYYGNSVERMAYNRDQVRMRLHADMGNQIMRYFKETRAALAAEAVNDITGLEHMTAQLLKESPSAQELLIAARKQLASTLLNNDSSWKESFNKLSQTVLTDQRIRIAINAYIDTQPDAAQSRKQLYADCCRHIRAALWKQLYHDLGRHHLDWTEPSANITKLRDMVKYLLEHHIGVHTQYDLLRQQMPEQRTPTQEILQGDFKAQFDQLTNTIRSDMRVRTLMDAYAAAYTVPSSQNEKAFRKQFYAECYREVSATVMEQLCTDTGYPAQARSDMAMNLVLSLFRMTAQGVNHQQNQRLYERHQRDRSRAAQRDYHNRHQQDSGWELE